MKYLHYILASFLLSVLVACGGPGIPGNGLLIEEVRDIEAFQSLSLSGCFSVKITVCDEISLVLSAEENLAPLIRTLSRGDELIIEPIQKISPTKTIDIELRTSSLIGINSSGSNNIVVEGIQTERFDLELVGADTALLSGEVGEFDANLSGAGSIRAMDLKAKKVSVTLTGAGAADVFAGEHLEAQVTGVGTIDYYGNPEKVDSSIAGVGSINRKKMPE